MKILLRSGILLILLSLLAVDANAQPGTPPGAGNALRFDGSDDYVNAGSWTPGASWTLEAWVRPLSSSTTRRVIVGGIGGCNDWALVVENNKFGVAYKSGSPDFCTSTLEAHKPFDINQWYHLAAVNDGTTLTLYINGELERDASVSLDYVGTSAGVRIGGLATGNNFHGVVDEVRIWNHDRTLGDIWCSMNRHLNPLQISNGAVGYYTFDVITGSTISDESGNGHDGTNNGANPIHSGVAIGPGDCVPVSGTGVVDVEDAHTTIELEFDETPDLRATITVTEMFAAPEGDPPPQDAPQDHYWVINAFDFGVPFTAHITYGLGDNYPSGLQGAPDAATLYSRGSTAEGPWSAIADGFTANDANRTVTFRDIHAFSQHTVGIQDERLPVELTSFDARLNGRHVEVTWRTASEVDNAGFEVERARYEGSHDPMYRTISSYLNDPSLTGLGTSNTGRAYRFDDPVDQLDTGVSYLYRIVDVTTDGIRTTHPPQSVAIAGESPEEPDLYQLDAIKPNPAHDEALVSFQVPEQAEVSIEIFAQDGKRCGFVPARQYDRGRYTEVLSVAGLPSGSYSIIVRMGTRTKEQRLSIVR